MKSLLVFKHIWNKIFINFIVNLSKWNNCIDIMMITNRLWKNLIMKSLLNLKVEIVVWVFIYIVYKNYELLNIIIINRNFQFLDYLWKRIYALLNIKKQFSTTFNNFSRRDRRFHRTNKRDCEKLQLKFHQLRIK